MQLPCLWLGRPQSVSDGAPAEQPPSPRRLEKCSHPSAASRAAASTSCLGLAGLGVWDARGGMAQPRGELQCLGTGEHPKKFTSHELGGPGSAGDGLEPCVHIQHAADGFCRTGAAAHKHFGDGQLRACCWRMEEPESNTTDPSPAGLISNTGRGPKAPSTLGRCPPASRGTPSSISLPPPPCPGGGDGRVKPQVPAKQVLAETASGAPLCPLPLSISLIPGQERGASPLPPDEEQSWRKPGWGPHPWAEGGMLGEWVEELGGGVRQGRFAPPRSISGSTELERRRAGWDGLFN